MKRPLSCLIRLRATALALPVVAGLGAAPLRAQEQGDKSQAYPQHQVVGVDLLQVPDAPAGTPNPPDIHLYGGKILSSYRPVDLPGTFQEREKAWSAQRPAVDAAQRRLLEQRYDFTGKVSADTRMSGGKPIPVGPVARLPKGIASWEALDALSADEIRRRDLFPYKPLPHPLTSTGGPVFPADKASYKRFDVDFDLPEAYLPEYPPPLFLTTRPDLGDVSKGQIVSEGNYFRMFNGILNPEQLEGARLATMPFLMEWFNSTDHRVVKEGGEISCFDCHVNGHTRRAAELDGTTFPQLLRARLDVPSLRGIQSQRLLGLRRGLRTVADHAQVEQYFGGDTGLKAALVSDARDRTTANRIESFISIIGFPPAPKLDSFERLDHKKATAAEARGEALFYGKARCSECHAPPAYSDNQMHDLQVERFYKGRAEGWAKTYPLRGIKESPPYFHDGRLPTLEDTVEFFNLILETHLSGQEKKDLVAFLRVL